MALARRCRPSQDTKWHQIHRAAQVLVKGQHRQHEQEENRCNAAILTAAVTVPSSPVARRLPTMQVLPRRDPGVAPLLQDLALRRGLRGYDFGLWSAVFPLGMHVVATHSYATVEQLSFTLHAG